LSKSGVNATLVDDDGATEPTKTRAIRRFIPMMWIDQSITLHDATLNRLTGVSSILQKGHSVHQSLKLAYILVALFSVIAIITVVELFFWNRRRKSSRRSLYQYEQDKPLLNHTLTTSPTTT